jgi:hypothetical protein
MLRVVGEDVRESQRKVVANQVVRGVAGEDSGEYAAAVPPVLAVDVRRTRRWVPGVKGWVRDNARVSEPDRSS